MSGMPPGGPGGAMMQHSPKMLPVGAVPQVNPVQPRMPGRTNQPMRLPTDLRHEYETYMQNRIRMMQQAGPSPTAQGPAQLVSGVSTTSGTPPHTPQTLRRQHTNMVY